MPKASIKYPDDIVTKNNNGGWHPKGKRAYRSAVRTFMQCLQTYKEPRLYQLCFEGKTHKAQMEMLNALVQIADRAGIECEWFACREVADMTKKDHIHAFIIINAHNVNVWSVFNQFDDGQVGQLCIKHGINFSIFPPKDEKGIHNGNTYMALPYQGPGNRQTPLGTERLADALVWLSYAYKARSKPTDEEADGQLFPASRPNRKRSIPLPSAALPAEKEEVTVEAIESDYKPLGGDIKPSEWVDAKSTPEPHQSPINASQTHSRDKGNELKLTPAQNYLATLYENAVDARMDIDAMRLYLLEQGVRRTPAQLVDELENTFGFLGYAASHVAPAKPDTRMLDALIDRTPLKSAKVRVFASDCFA